MYINEYINEYLKERHNNQYKNYVCRKQTKEKIIHETVRE